MSWPEIPSFEELEFLDYFKNSDYSAEDYEKGKAIIRNQIRDNCGLKKRQQLMTMENFNAKPQQREAYEHCKSFVDSYLNGSEGNQPTGLMICGAVGGGKTHLASAIANTVIENVEIKNITAARALLFGNTGQRLQPLMFANFTELLNRVRNSFNNGESDKIIDEHKKVPLLILDDIGAEKNSEWTQSVVYEIVDYRYNEMLPLVITTNLTVRDIADKLGSRIADRLRSCCKLVTIDIKSQRKTAV